MKRRDVFNLKSPHIGAVARHCEARAAAAAMKNTQEDDGNIPDGIIMTVTALAQTQTTLNTTKSSDVAAPNQTECVKSSTRFGSHFR